VPVDRFARGLPGGMIASVEPPSQTGAGGQVAALLIAPGPQMEQLSRLVDQDL